MELGLGMVVIVTKGVTMVHLSIRSISHGPRVEQLVTVEAGETSSVVHVLPARHL